MSLLWLVPTPVDSVPRQTSAKTFFVTLKFKATGHEATYHEKSAFNRATLILVTQQYADVVAQGETDLHDA